MEKRRRLKSSQFWTWNGGFSVAKRHYRFTWCRAYAPFVVHRLFRSVRNFISIFSTWNRRVLFKSSPRENPKKSDEQKKSIENEILKRTFANEDERKTKRKKNFSSQRIIPKTLFFFDFIHSVWFRFCIVDERISFGAFRTVHLLIKFKPKSEGERSHFLLVLFFESSVCRFNFCRCYSLYFTNSYYLSIFHSEAL